MKRTTLPIGVISAGTMNPHHVGAELAWALRPLRLSRAERAIVNQWVARDQFDEDVTQALCSELEEIASAHCPSMAYYGSSEGDGACFGVWPVDDDDDTQCFGDLAEIPKGFEGDCYVRNDHGNVTYGYVTRGKFREVWSLV